ncbi:MAG: hypothetical protein HRU26_07120 [Psychroserpens sp.]|nr:hypothetical protein [Psychroserpens sp.]
MADNDRVCSQCVDYVKKITKNGVLPLNDEIRRAQQNFHGNFHGSVASGNFEFVSLALNMELLQQQNKHLIRRNSALLKGLHKNVISKRWKLKWFVCYMMCIEIEQLKCKEICILETVEKMTAASSIQLSDITGYLPTPPSQPPAATNVNRANPFASIQLHDITEYFPAKN